MTNIVKIIGIRALSMKLLISRQGVARFRTTPYREICYCFLVSGATTYKAFELIIRCTSF